MKFSIPSTFCHLLMQKVSRRGTRFLPSDRLLDITLALFGEMLCTREAFCFLSCAWPWFHSRKKVWLCLCCSLVLCTFYVIVEHLVKSNESVFLLLSPPLPFHLSAQCQVTIINLQCQKQFQVAYFLLNLLSALDFLQQWMRFKFVANTFVSYFTAPQTTKISAQI